MEQGALYSELPSPMRYSLFLIPAPYSYSLFPFRSAASLPICCFFVHSASSLSIRCFFVSPRGCAQELVQEC